MVCENEFLSWMERNPQVVVWLPTLSRIVIAETGKYGPPIYSVYVSLLFIML